MLTFRALRRTTDPDFLKSPSVWICSSKDVQASTRKLKERNLFRWPDRHLTKSCSPTQVHEQTKLCPPFRSSGIRNPFNLCDKKVTSSCLFCFLNYLWPIFLSRTTSISCLILHPSQSYFISLLLLTAQDVSFISDSASYPSLSQHSPIRLSPPLLQQNSSQQGHQPMVTCLHLVLPAPDTLDHSLLLDNIIFHDTSVFLLSP